MRLTTLHTEEGTRAARLDADGPVLLPASDVGEALRVIGVDALGDVAGPIIEGDLRRAPLVTSPTKIICLGLNYESHIREMGRDLPTHPTLFVKFVEALIGPRDAIQLPPESTEVDWEAELAFVIGRPARRIAADEAMDAIAGFTVLNDISMRDWQWRTTEWLQGKTWERSTPIGPDLVTVDELDTNLDLHLTCEIDGELLQDARTSDLVHDPATIVSYVSTFVTLQPGDVISTGTPGGVGAGLDPRRFLAPGMTVRTSIEGIGELVNVCVEESITRA